MTSRFRTFRYAVKAYSSTGIGAPDRFDVLAHDVTGETPPALIERFHDRDAAEACARHLNRDLMADDAPEAA